MAKAPAATSATKNEDSEAEVLFGHLTDEERARAGLSDEELAGITGDDEGDEAEADAADEADAKESEADEADEDAESEGDEEKGDEAEDEADDAEEAEGAEESEEAQDDPAKEPAADEQAEADDDDPLMETRSVLPNEWSLPANARERVTELENQSAELATSFDAGDLTAREYHEQLAKITDERMTLKMQITNAEQSFSKAMSHWETRTVRRFLREHPEWKSNPTTLTLLDGEVRRLQKDSNDPFDPRHLRKAHDNLMKAMRLDGADKAPTKDAKKQAEKKPALPPGKKPAIPPTLARIPADQIEDTSGGRFARLDRLERTNPSAFEEAVAKLSPAQREEYLSGA